MIIFLLRPTFPGSHVPFLMTVKATELPSRVFCWKTAHTSTDSLHQELLSKPSQTVSRRVLRKHTYLSFSITSSSRYSTTGNVNPGMWIIGQWSVEEGIREETNILHCFCNRATKPVGFFWLFILKFSWKTLNSMPNKVAEYKKHR